MNSKLLNAPRVFLSSLTSISFLGLESDERLNYLSPNSHREQSDCICSGSRFLNIGVACDAPRVLGSKIVSLSTTVTHVGCSLLGCKSQQFQARRIGK